MAFTCGVCHRHQDLCNLADVSCPCLVCNACFRDSVRQQLCSDSFQPSLTPPPAQPKPREACPPAQPAPAGIMVGDTVLYLTADDDFVEATVKVVDVSVQPPQYGIQLVGASDLRFTERERLTSTAATPPQAQPQKRPARSPATAALSKIDLGDVVLYRTVNGDFVEATVEIIDISVVPPQYGIQLAGSPNVRFTEEERLRNTKQGAASASPMRQKPPLSPVQHQQQQSVLPRLSAHCALCSTPLPAHLIRALAPEAVVAWEADRTASWLKVHDVIACPHPGCGALIQRVPDFALGAKAGVPGNAAAAHRERHRYRCGACGRDFCDACFAAPYHTGYTCSQARAPDCLLCGGKVEEDRLKKLLPLSVEAAAMAAGDGEGGTAGPRRSPRLRSAGASVGSWPAAGAGGGAEAKGVQAEAAAVLPYATNSELQTALRSKVVVDTVWCLERSDLERAMLHWGCHTCSSRDCAAKLRAMCTRPLPCGHWCCGLRGEGEAGAVRAHPRCVECGAESSPAAAAGRSGAAAATISECCFCWEALSSGPCIEMACGPRHMCHLQCALDRLNAGYPGPHISFAHLYCPLCRNAAAGSGGSGAMQSALGRVHLEHPALAAALQPHLDLRSGVVAAVRGRLKVDARLKADPDLQPGGRYDGRPADFGLERLLFYKCSKCCKPYYGGQRACGAAGPGDAAQQPQQAGAGIAGGAGANPAQQQEPRQPDQADQQLVCGECLARSCGANCPRHGTTYIEWKCKYCCSLASWFCFGTTHMCEPCHSQHIARTFRHPATSPATVCTGPNCGLKGTPHPPPGQEACLGCGMCRAGL